MCHTCGVGEAVATNVCILKSTSVHTYTEYSYMRVLLHMRVYFCVRIYGSYLANHSVGYCYS